MVPEPAHVHGWTAVPRSIDAILANMDKANTRPFKVSDIALPQSETALKTMAYAKEHLPLPTFHHSMRVFYYGSAFLQNHEPAGLVPSPGLTESFFLCCMLHDIGTTPTNMPLTRLSFELWGALHALTLLPTLGAPPDQAELVAEVISRHQDLGDVGSVPAVLALVYVGTLLDNVGLCAEFVSADTVGAVTGAWPRLKWSGCFAGTVRKELGLKPWAHSSVIDGFAEAVEGNRVMEAYE